MLVPVYHTRLIWIARALMALGTIGGLAAVQKSYDVTTDHIAPDYFWAGVILAALGTAGLFWSRSDDFRDMFRRGRVIRHTQTDDELRETEHFG